MHFHPRKKSAYVHSSKNNCIKYLFSEILLHLECIMVFSYPHLCCHRIRLRCALALVREILPAKALLEILAVVRVGQLHAISAVDLNICRGTIPSEKEFSAPFGIVSSVDFWKQIKCSVIYCSYV